MTFIEELRAEFDVEMEKTRAILEHVPEGKLDWKAHEKSMTLGRLAGHIAEIPSRVANIVRTEMLVRVPGYTAFSATSHAELMKKFTESVDEARGALAELREDQLSDIWTIKFGDKTILELPKAKSLRTVVMNHLIHHRGQLSVYLRLLDVPVPGMFGPSADEK